MLTIIIVLDVEQDVNRYLTELVILDAGGPVGHYVALGLGAGYGQGLPKG